MNFNLLRYAVAVSEEKSISQAARRLFMAQPSLSHSIRLLEKELGATLFDRTKSPLETTAAGRRFIDWAYQTLLSEQEMRRGLTAVSSDHQRKLSVGISRQRCYKVLPSAIKAFYDATTQCTVVLNESYPEELTKLLDRNIVDFILDWPFPEMMKYGNIPIADEKVLIAAPSSYHLKSAAGGKYPSVLSSELTGKPVIALSGNNSFMDILQSIYNYIGCAPAIAMECESPDLAYTMVSNQLGITLMPEFCAKDNNLPGVCYYDISDFPITRALSVTYLKDRALPDDAHQLISILTSLL